MEDKEREAEDKKYVEELEELESLVDFVCDHFDCDPNCDSCGHESSCAYSDPLIAWKKVLKVIEIKDLNDFIASKLKQPTTNT